MIERYEAKAISCRRACSSRGRVIRRASAVQESKQPHEFSVKSDPLDRAVELEPVGSESDEAPGFLCRSQLTGQYGLEDETVRASQLTTPRQVDLVSEKASACPPGLCLSALEFLLLRGRSEVGFGRGRSNRTHPLPAFLPVSVRQRDGDEVVVGLLDFRTGPSASCLCGCRLPRGSVEGG